jgi:hemolysin activation/secretion protein
MGTLSRPGGDTSFALSAVQNVAGGPRGGAQDFERTRAGAKASWKALRFSAALAYALGADWQARLLANGQLTADALVPGEQFGAGGSTSVRGFGERDLATDSGVVLNLEAYTPDLCQRLNWQCRALAFYDTAYGKRNHALAGELASTTISSAGLGLRFAAGSSASVQLDYGHALHTGALSGTGKNKLHVRVGLAY